MLLSAMQLDGFFACEAGNAVAQAVEAGAIHDFSSKIVLSSSWWFTAGEYVVAAVACFNMLLHVLAF